MKQKIETILRKLFFRETNVEPPIKIEISSQFDPEKQEDYDVIRNLNSAFLIALSGKDHPLSEEARVYFENWSSHERWSYAVKFFKDGINLIQQEIGDEYSNDENFKHDFEALYSFLEIPQNPDDRNAMLDKIRQLFFPEGVRIKKNEKNEINLLREKRKVRLSGLNPNPIKDPVGEILFTSNVLLTTPSVLDGAEDLNLNPMFLEKLKQIKEEKQLYWYDHPIQVGVNIEKNEVIYGLRGLNEAVQFEIEQGTIRQDQKLNVLLSASVTHEGLHDIAKDYLKEEIGRSGGFPQLNIYLFTETDTKRLLDEILIPALKEYSDENNNELLYEIVGVDGKYGKHYCFLKAVSALWKVLIDPDIKATFKIDLDQVFPQKELVQNFGFPAFENFRSPLWGAEGIESNGNSVLLGMIAGSLVNQKDIEESIFTPDVPFPEGEEIADEIFFSSRLPQALSTEAEMMTRYDNENLDGKTSCIQRIHVTGGTTGILIDSLRKYRPFTPTFIGRAEDQAYILSVLFKDPQMNLRYLHKDGLIMRHDKEFLVQEAIREASMGKIISDYTRMLWFSYYVRALPCALDKIKGEIDPFTGCFVSRIPFTIVYLRLALKAASFFAVGDEEGGNNGCELLELGIKRLSLIISELDKKINPLIDRYKREKKGWNLYYDILDHLESGIKNNDSFALHIQEKARKILESCKIKM